MPIIIITIIKIWKKANNKLNLVLLAKTVHFLIWKIIDNILNQNGIQKMSKESLKKNKFCQKLNTNNIYQIQNSDEVIFKFRLSKKKKKELSIYLYLMNKLAFKKS